MKTIATNAASDSERGCFDTVLAQRYERWYENMSRARDFWRYFRQRHCDEVLATAKVSAHERRSTKGSHC